MIDLSHTIAMHLVSSLEQNVIDARLLSWASSDFDTINVILWGTTANFSAYVIVHEAGTTKKHKCKLSGGTWVIPDSSLAGMDASKCIVSVAPSADCFCSININAISRKAGVQANVATFGPTNFAAFGPSNPNWPTINGTMTVDSGVTVGVDEQAKDVEPECKCRSLLWGHERGCHFASKR